MTMIHNPRTGAVERELHPVSAAELREHVTGLRAAQPAWEALGTDGRGAALHRWGDALSAAGDALAGALTADTGRAYESRMEAQQVAGMAHRWADAAGPLLAPLVRPSGAIPGIDLETGARPYPLVGVISPWNFPLLLGLIDAIPALAAGCAVLIKPSEVTPRFIEPLVATVDAVPELRDVLRVVEGDGETGAAMIDLIDAVCFTGSVATGRLVGRAAASAFIPAFLELGGKDPAIVLDGANLDRASSAILWGGIANSGQSCLSIERIYVEQSVYEQFVDLLAAKAEAVTLALPDPGDGQLGPLIDPAQADIISTQLDAAYAAGAKALTGGVIERHGGGYWLRPTVLTGVDHSMTIMREETFGPILPVMPVADAEEAVALANDTDFGLSAAVFASDRERAAGVGRRLNAGAVSLNDAGLTTIVHEGEKNSFNRSGLGGSRMGAAGLSRFVRKQTLIANAATGRDPWWNTP